MANQIVLEKRTTKLIKPSKQTPSQTLSLSTLDSDPYNETMYCTIYVYRGENTARVGDPELLLGEALSSLLAYYYPLSGKLARRRCDRKLQLSCIGEGVPYTVATANLQLSSLNYLENIDFEAVSQLLPQTYENVDDGENGYHPLALQVTKFLCGGFTIGTALTHAVCDGFGVARFIGALMELAAGKRKPTVMPVWERERLVGSPDDQPAKIPGGDKPCLLAISPYIPTKDPVTEIINIRAESIRRLKEALSRESKFLREEFTTFEALGAYVWRSRSRALNLNVDGISVFGFPVGIRHVLEPPLPDGYYGNACIDLHVQLTRRELEVTPISSIAKLIKEAKSRALDKEYAEEEIGNIEKLVETDTTFGGRKDGLMYLTDWRNIGMFGSMDFGWGEPVNLVPVVPPEEALNLGMLLRPSKLDPSVAEGVKLVMTLPRDAMPKFKEEMISLSKLGGGACGA